MDVPYGRIGQFIPRKEDLPLIQGQGHYSDDFNLRGEAYAHMVRSPYAHARILTIDKSAAERAPGVLAVLCGADAAAAGLQPIPHTPVIAMSADIALENRSGPPFLTRHLVLPTDKVRFVGEAVVVIVADSVGQAKDAAELVRIEYEPLSPVVDATAALQAGAPCVWEAAPENLCIDAEVGDAEGTDAAFERAAHVVKVKTWIHRVTGVPMEPRAAVAEYDAETRRYTLYAGSGNVVRQKRELSTVLGISAESVRVVARDVGGNFGTRNPFYPEFALIAWAARLIGRPVKWTCERQEAFLSDCQGRDLAVEAELALDADGNFLALRSTNISNIGAQTITFGPLTKGVELMSSVYRIPVAHVKARGVLTNTPPTNSYRSSGRPEAMLVMERLIDLAASKHGFDRVALRRRNLIPQMAMPFTNPLGLTYDSGAYEQTMDSALAGGFWDGFEDRRQEARLRGKRRGISVANYIEITSGIPRERAEITIDPSERVDVVVGTISSGQGHETSFAQLVAEWLGVPFESVRLITGDTDKVPVGGGSHAGRSMRLGSIVIGKAVHKIVERGKLIAAFAFDAPESDIEFAEGRFRVRDAEESIGLFEIARRAATTELPENLRGLLSAECDETVLEAGFPFGCHVGEVEIDPETGAVEIVRYVAVDDVGRAVNPLILHGQTHGGIVQGVGQALCEQCVYDRESGQLLSGSFMDYAILRAGDLPFFDTELSEVPSPTNPLGVRAGGEGGTTPALAIIVNAVVDALAEYGVEHIEMPITPERVWRAIWEADSQNARAIGNMQ